MGGVLLIGGRDIGEGVADVIYSGTKIVRNSGDISSLSSYTYITGFLAIQMSDLEDLSGLGSLTRIGNGLIVRGNTSLTSLDGLESLTQVDGIVHIDGNGILADIDGLTNLVSIGGSLSIYENASLANLDGLGSLTTIGLSMFIGNNDSLTSIAGLSAIESISTSILVRDNIDLETSDINSFTAGLDGSIRINSPIVTGNK
jgi:hypothetical protein